MNLAPASVSNPGLLRAMCALLALVGGCGDKSKEGGGEASAEPVRVQFDDALRALADTSEKYAAAHEGKLPQTSAPVYCRGGRAVVEKDDLFKTTLGYAMPGDFKGVDLCFNVSEDRKKVALLARESPISETGRCLKVDVSGSKPKRSEIEDSKLCLP